MFGVHQKCEQPKTYLAYCLGGGVNCSQCNLRTRGAERKISKLQEGRDVNEEGKVVFNKY